MQARCLPALRSDQTELGVKWQPSARVLVTASAFSIDKPYADDQTTASGIPLRVAGGKTARHRGLELAAVGQVDTQLSLQASLTLLNTPGTPPPWTRPWWANRLPTYPRPRRRCLPTTRSPACPACPSAVC
jgi:outer membrane receptor protein involved in Fe transport